MSLCESMDWSLPGSSVHGISQAKNTWAGCCFLLQGIFLTQGLNIHLLCFLHYRQILYCWATGEAHVCTQSQLLPSPRSPCCVVLQQLLLKNEVKEKQNNNLWFFLFWRWLSLPGLCPCPYSCTSSPVPVLFLKKYLSVHFYFFGCAGSLLLHEGSLVASWGT